MSWLLFATSNSTYVRLYPNWDMSFQSYQTRTEHETRSGRRFVYKFGLVNKWKFNVSYISSSDKCVINSWWGANNALYFIDEDNGTATNSVMIFNDKLPIDGYEKPYTTLFNGTLELGTY